MFNREVYINRRNQLRTKISSGIALILGNNETPMNYPGNTYHFRQDSNFLYFFGLDHAGYAGVLDIDENKDILFANDLDMDDIIWMGPQPSVKEQASKVGVENTMPFDELQNYIQKAISQGRKIHFLPPYKGENKILLESLVGIKPAQQKEKASVELIKGIVSLREIKEKCEIEEIDRACNTGYLMHTTAMKMAHPGMSEREIAGVIEGISLSRGGVTSFPIILSMNGQTLHNHDHSNMLQEGRMMIVDAGCETTLHYASDNTRTVPVGGKFNQRQREIYQAVVDANNHANTLIKPEVFYRDVHFGACEVIANSMKALGLMKGDMKEAVQLGAHALFMPHGLGHMMGLDVHDMEDLGENYVGYNEEIQRSTIFGTAFVRLGKRLKENFVITNEPGIYFIPELIDQWKAEKKFEQFINYDKVETYKDFGGIRLEDDILVTSNGCRIMGDERIPISVEEVEDLMRR